MPRRHNPDSYRPAPDWLSTWDAIFAALRPRAIQILQPIDFYARHDLEIPLVDEVRALDGVEKAAIERIATALTVAVDYSCRTPPGVVRAWLERIAKRPSLFRTGRIPPEAHWAIAANYRRKNEPTGAHLEDVLGRRRVSFSVKARRPTANNIARAARNALQTQQRRLGRPRNTANRLLAESLAMIFRELGGRIVRQQSPIDVQGRGVLDVDSGPFFKFLEEVIRPLKRHLKANGVRGVTLETIERIAAEQFA